MGRLAKDRKKHREAIIPIVVAGYRKDRRVGLLKGIRPSE
jgi:hypothetical protein